eukprot:SAG11_NODE_99_length_16913_cov_41.552813_4_plen_43_part_00
MDSIDAFVSNLNSTPKISKPETQRQFGIARKRCATANNGRRE